MDWIYLYTLFYGENVLFQQLLCNILIWLYLSMMLFSLLDEIITNGPICLKCQDSDSGSSSGSDSDADDAHSPAARLPVAESKAPPRSLSRSEAKHG